MHHFPNEAVDPPAKPCDEMKIIPARLRAGPNKYKAVQL